MRIKNAKEFVREVMRGDHTKSFLLETINKQYSPEIRPVFFEEFFVEARHVYLDLLLDLSDEDILRIIEEFKDTFGYLPVMRLDIGGFLKVKHFIRKVGEYTIVSNGIIDYEYVFETSIEPIYLDKIVKAVWDNFSLFNSLSIQEKYKGFQKLIELESAIITIHPDLPKQIHRESFTHQEKKENHSSGGGKESEAYRLRISEKAKADEHTVEIAKMVGDNSIKVGDEMFIVPLPVNKSEAIERLKKLHGQRVFESMVSAFEKKFEANDLVPISNEIKKIDEFISQANKLDIDRAFAGKDVLHEEGEYLRLKHGYYRKDRVVFKKGSSEIEFFGRHAPEVFGRFFLFKDWLTDKYRCAVEVLKNKEESKTEQPLAENTENETVQILSLKQIALKYIYEGKQITRENGNEIAREYGYTSGEKLFQHYTFYTSVANRKGKPTPLTQKKLSNKIALIESVIAILPTDKQQRAVDELEILKKIFESEYQ